VNILVLVGASLVAFLLAFRFYSSSLAGSYGEDMIGFTIIMILLVTSSFLVAAATSLTSLVPIAKLQLPETQT
jgi:hypothetical protein